MHNTNSKAFERSLKSTVQTMIENGKSLMVMDMPYFDYTATFDGKNDNSFKIIPADSLGFKHPEVFIHESNKFFDRFKNAIMKTVKEMIKDGSLEKAIDEPFASHTASYYSPDKRKAEFTFSANSLGFEHADVFIYSD